METYFINLLIALDQLANTVYGGYPDGTLSARSYREKRWSERWINLLFFWQTDEKGKRNHCEQCYQHEKARMDLAPEYRDCPKCGE
ncbi:MAG: hypothetical protein LBI05_00195 [Planctomycetaceae bacterium]|jgi:hypothetical protein|nr:hypothetical protein [Planctomycetaceae bacterium]